MPKQVKRGKYLWNVTVREGGTHLKETYTLTSDTLMAVNFAELSKRALSVAHKDKGNWYDPANLYVSEITENGTVDG